MVRVEASSPGEVAAYDITASVFYIHYTLLFVVSISPTIYVQIDHPDSEAVLIQRVNYYQNPAVSNCCYPLPSIQNGYYSENCSFRHGLQAGESCVFRCNVYHKFNMIISTSNVTNRLKFECDEAGYWIRYPVSCDWDMEFVMYVILFKFCSVLSCALVIFIAFSSVLVPQSASAQKWIFSHSVAFKALLLFHAMPWLPTRDSKPFLMFSLLHTAIETNNVDGVRLIVTSNLLHKSVSRRNDMTPLQRAMKMGNKEIVVLLLENPDIGGDVNDTDNQGRTALTLLLQNAVSASFQVPQQLFEIIELMTQKGCLVNKPKWNFATAIDRAPLDICRRLAHHGADLNSKLKNGMTVLHVAIATRSMEKVRFLIEILRKQNMRIDKWNNLSALDYAVATECKPKIIDILCHFEKPSKEKLTRAVRKFRMNEKIKNSVVSELVQLGLTSGVSEFFRNRNELLKENIFGLSAYDYAFANTDTRSKITKFRPAISDRKGIKEWYALRNRWPNKITPVQKEKRKEKHYFPGTRKATFTCSDVLRDARMYLNVYADEVLEIKTCVHEFLGRISFAISQIEEFKYLEYTPELAGSVSEDTKVFLPDEFDYVCVLNDANKYLVIEQSINSGVHAQIRVNSHPFWTMLCDKAGYIDSWKFNRCFLDALDKAMRLKNINRHGNLHCHRFCLDRNSRLPKLRLKWCGKFFKDLDISMDIVPAFLIQDGFKSLNRMVLTKSGQRLYVIPKGSHHSVETAWPISFNTVETDTMRNSPVKPAYIFAKALRLPDICFRDNATDLKLVESVNIEDYLRSYYFKNILILLFREYTFEDSCTPEGSVIKWTELIYETLEEHLLNGVMRPFYTTDKQIYLFQCNHKLDLDYSHKRKCCQNRSLTLLMCRNVLRFLREDPDYDVTPIIKHRKRTPFRGFQNIFAAPLLLEHVVNFVSISAHVEFDVKGEDRRFRTNQTPRQSALHRNVNDADRECIHLADRTTAHQTIPIADRSQTVQISPDNDRSHQENLAQGRTARTRNRLRIFNAIMRIVIDILWAVFYSFFAMFQSAAFNPHESISVLAQNVNEWCDQFVLDFYEKLKDVISSSLFNYSNEFYS